MATTRGRCTNVDYCSLAASRRDVEVKIGQDFVCPECGRPLRPPPMEAAPGRSGVFVAAGIGAALLAAGGLYAGYRLSSPGTAPAPAPAAPIPSTPISKPAPAPPQAAAQPIPTPPQASVPPPPPKPEQAILLRLDSSGAAAALAPRLAAAYLASLGDTSLSTVQGAAPGETLVAGLRVGRKEAISLVAGARRDGPAADVSLADIGPAALGDGAQLVALAPAYVAVNAGNPVAAITLAQLRAMLEGGVARWTVPGGSGRPIHLVEPASPAGQGLAALVPGNPSMPAGTPRAADAGGRVAADPDALALLPALPATGVHVLAVAALGARPALPTLAAVSLGQYPLVRRVVVRVPAGGGNPFAARLAAFAVSPEGQAAVAQAGLVPLHVASDAPQAAAAPLTPKDRYRALVVGATRLAADLHFEPSSNKLDLHSAREVDRVWNFMMSDHTPSDHLVLLGFADNQGTPEANMSLSQQRAQAVADVFARRGLPPGRVVAFGADLPVADNGSEAGREKNRRVEVFLRN